jgi:cytidine deaminase
MRTALLIEGELSEQRFAYLTRLKQLAEMLIIRALDTSMHSQSYRPFPVGCAAIGIGTHSLSAPRVFTGHNMKVHKNARVTCGEVIAVGSARQAGCSHIPMLAVAGTPQTDQSNGLQHPTLHPCHRCRDEFCSLECISDDTLFITATIEAAKRLQEDARTVFGKLQQRHDERTGFMYYEPLHFHDNQEPNLWLDQLIDNNEAEVFTFLSLLKTDNHQCC